MSLTNVARKYSVNEVRDTNKLANNGGQIVYAVLTDTGIQTEQFLTSKGVQTGAPRARRSMRRAAASTAVPQHTSIKELQEKAKKKKYEANAVAKAIDTTPGQFEQLYMKDSAAIHR